MGVLQRKYLYKLDIIALSISGCSNNVLGYVIEVARINFAVHTVMKFNNWAIRMRLYSYRVQ